MATLKELSSRIHIQNLTNGFYNVVYFEKDGITKRNEFLTTNSAAYDRIRNLAELPNYIKYSGYTLKQAYQQLYNEMIGKKPKITHWSQKY
jgi:hypothetical protein